MRATRFGGLALSLVVAGALFLGTPATTAGGALPDPADMARLAETHNSSAENVAFWAERVEHRPDSVPALVQLAGAQLALAGDTGDLAGYEAGEETAARAVSLAPGRVDPLLVLARARAGQHAFDDAIDLAERALAIEPTNISALLVAGDAHLGRGDVALARTRFDQATARVGGAAPMLSRYARLASLTGTLAEAESLAHRALVEAGDIDLRAADAAFYWFQLATFEFARGDAAAAHASVTSALAIDPAHVGSNELLPRTLVALGDVEGAIARYEEITADGAGADLHGALAELYRRTGRTAEARRQVELGLAAARESADRFPAERRHNISFLADHDPAAALRLAALDLVERRDIHAHAWYAWALLQAGDVEGAVEAIEPALVYATEDALLRYQAGMIRAAAGDADAARELLASALELNPHFDIRHADLARAQLADVASSAS